MSDDWDYTSLLAVGGSIVAASGMAAWYVHRMMFGQGGAPPHAVVPGPGAAPLGNGNHPGPGPVQPPIPLAPPLPLPVVQAQPMAPVGVSRALQNELLGSHVARRIRVNAGLRGSTSAAGDLGHLASRHGPDLTDQELRGRLLTGLDREGVPAPTAGVSSRFSSEELLASTLATVFRQVQAALGRTRQMLNPNVVAYANAQAAFSNLQTLLLLPGMARASAGMAQASQARAQELNDLQLALTGTQNAAATGLAPMLPVYWSGARQRIELFERYVFIHSHGGHVGVGYYGTQPRPNSVVNGIAPDGLGKTSTMTLYGNVQAYAGPLDETLTVLEVAGFPDRAYGRAHDPLRWNVVTHYPTGRVAGGNALTRGFDDYSGHN